MIPMPAFTPGPWVPLVKGHKTVGVRGSRETTRAVAGIRRQPDPYEEDANAYLIGAAPEYDAATCAFLMPYNRVPEKQLKAIAESDQRYRVGTTTIDRHIALAVLGFRFALSLARGAPNPKAPVEYKIKNRDGPSTCHKCGKKKPASEFYPQSRRTCKKCIALLGRDRRRAARLREGEMKHCHRCNTDKPASQFHYQICFECRNASTRKYLKEHRKEWNEYVRNYRANKKLGGKKEQLEHAAKAMALRLLSNDELKFLLPLKQEDVQALIRERALADNRQRTKSNEPPSDPMANVVFEDVEVTE